MELAISPLPFSFFWAILDKWDICKSSKDRLFALNTFFSGIPGVVRWFSRFSQTCALEYLCLLPSCNTHHVVKMQLVRCASLPHRHSNGLSVCRGINSTPCYKALLCVLPIPYTRESSLQVHPVIAMFLSSRWKSPRKILNSLPISGARSLLVEHSTSFLVVRCKFRMVIRGKVR